MKQILEEQKEQLKEELCKEVDRYYEELSTGLEGRKIKIDDIERMLGETQQKVCGKVIKATGEAVTNTESPTEKNNAPIVKGK